MLADAYQSFLQGKVDIKISANMSVAAGELHPGNKPHQNVSIEWAASRGQALLALKFGLGKTRIQTELAKIIVQRTGKKFLLICPLGVKYQFVDEDGPVLGITWQYCRTDAEILAAQTPYIITNYERVRDGQITPALHDFGGVSLDEGSVIHSFGAKTTQAFKRLLKDIPYKFVATATPSPNEFKEIIYYADFLGVKDTGQILTEYFMRNPDKAGDLRLIPQQESKFWLWVSSWALFLYAPSDLGFSDEGYDLPKLNVHWRRINVDQTRAFKQVDKYSGQHRLLLDAAAGVTESAAETRETVMDRVMETRKIMDENPGRHWLLWHHQEAERKAIGQIIPEAVTVYGSQKIEAREKIIRDFAHGEIPILATKPEIAGSGCNFQHFCHSMIFVGPSYKFKDFIQAVHRAWRFQQWYEVDVWVVFTESQDPVVAEMKRKWAQHDELTEKMREIIRTHKLSVAALAADAGRTMDVERKMTEGKLFTAVNNDCVKELRSMPDNSMDMWCTSIPFGNHYEYTLLLNDFGHNPSDTAFFEQMDFLIPELLRVLKPGRIAAIHVKDRIVYRYQTQSEFMETSPFMARTTLAFQKHGWMYMGLHVAVTDVVRENASSYRLGWTEATHGDMTKMGAGLPEYILLFRKPPSDKTNSRADVPVRKNKIDIHACPACGYVFVPDDMSSRLHYPTPETDEEGGDLPVEADGWSCPGCGDLVQLDATKGYSRARWQIDAHAFWRSSGDRPMLPDEIYDYEAHVAQMEAKDRKGALSKKYMMDAPKSQSPWVWTDVLFMQTLNSAQMKKRKEKHICPLPFDIVRRLIRMYSNDRERVGDMFAGLFTVPVVAMQMDREGWGCELNPDYYRAGVKYCEAAQAEAMMPTLFDYLQTPAPEELK